MRHCNYLMVLLTLCFFNISHLAPVDPKKSSTDDIDKKLEGFKLDYQHYLEQVASLLENDSEFADQLRKTPPEKLQTGEIADFLPFVKHNVRTKLDELKRREMDRLREYALKQMEGSELGSGSFKTPKHLDYKNSHTFEVDDLKKLISAAYSDLMSISDKRKEDFKHYEMEKEHAYREKLREVNETEREEIKRKHDEMIKKHKDHPKINHPGSKAQLEEVWEKEDHLPRNEFDPKVFFSMHDLNGDNFLDDDEVEAFLTNEIKKMYDPENAEDDLVERMEEYARMSEHIFNETDHNKDGLISRQEFLDMAGRQDFDATDGWEALDEEVPFTDEEMEEYEKEIAKRKEEIAGIKEEKPPVSP